MENQQSGPGDDEHEAQNGKSSTGQNVHGILPPGLHHLIAIDTEHGTVGADESKDRNCRCNVQQNDQGVEGR